MSFEQLPNFQILSALGGLHKNSKKATNGQTKGTFHMFCVNLIENRQL